MKLPDWARAARSHWKYDGSRRPDFADDVPEGCESVWDYPRPPRVAADAGLVTVAGVGGEIARTSAAVRVMETASPPVFYLPPDCVDFRWLAELPGSSACEWKGVARYWGLAEASRSGEVVAWAYEDPFPGFESIAGYLSFYPARVDCFVDGERVRPQPGGFYGGWVTDKIVGPFKGTPGTGGW